MLIEKMEISLPTNLCERLDEVVELLDFGSREEFAEAAVRRLLDRYAVLMRRISKE